jgi:hypothetical protein
MIVQVARVARAVRLRHFSSAASGSPTIVYDPVSHIVSSPFKIEVSPLNLPDYLWRNLSSVESKPAIVRYTQTIFQKKIHLRTGFCADLRLVWTLIYFWPIVQQIAKFWSQPEEEFGIEKWRRGCTGFAKFARVFHCLLRGSSCWTGYNFCESYLYRW